MRRNIRYSDFSGGLNTTDNPFTLQPNELQQCDNFVSDRRGNLHLRRGYIEINTVPLSYQPITGLYRFYPNTGPPVLIATIGDEHGAGFGTIGFYNERGVASLDYPKGNRDFASFASIADRFYYCAGGSLYRCTASAAAVAGQSVGSAMYPTCFRVHVEMDAPAVGTNQIMGPQVWAVSQMTQFGESGLSNVRRTTHSDESTLFHAHLYGLSSIDNLHVRLWRAACPGGATGAYKLLADFDPSVAGYYVDNTGASLLGEQWDDVINYIGDYDFYVITKFQNRIFGVRQDTRTDIRWTRAGEPESWPLVNMERVGAEDGEWIQALTPLSDRLLIFKASKIFALYGDFSGAGLYGSTIVSDRIGTRNPHCIGQDGDVVYFLADDGVWRYDGNLTYVSGKIQDTLKGLPTAQNREHVAGGVHGRKYWLSVSEGGLGNDATYVLDLDRLALGEEVWSRFNFGVQVFANSPNDTNYDVSIGPFMGANTAGKILRLDNDSSDNYMTDHGAAITGIIKTAPLDARMPDDRKIFRRVWPWIIGTQGNLQVQVQDDYGENYQVHTKSLTANATRPLPMLLVNDDILAGNTLELIVTYSQTGYNLELSALDMEVIPRPHRPR